MGPNRLSSMYAFCAALLILAGLAAIPAQAQNDSLTDEERRRLEALKSLPYGKWTDKSTDEKETGVTIYDREAAWPGYTLYSGPGRAVLVDMEGTEVHEWTNPALKEWEFAEMQPNGDVIVLLARRSICRLDWDGNLLWQREAAVHHDYCYLPDGDIAALVHEKVDLPEFGAEPIESDAIVRITPDGEITTIWHLHEHRDELARWCPEEALRTISNDVSADDWSHANTLEMLIDTPAASAIEAFRPGNLLIGVRNLDFVGIIDIQSGEIVWGWGPGVLDHPHQPTLLSNGNLLIFDNGFFRGWTRIVEYDPVAQRIVWDYKTNPLEEFFSRGRGACQELPNGNVLITDSAHGRVFEVTRERKIVWTFFNVERSRDRRGTFYRSYRYPVELVEGLLKTR